MRVTAHIRHSRVGEHDADPALSSRPLFKAACDSFLRLAKPHGPSNPGRTPCSCGLSSYAVVECLPRDHVLPCYCSSVHRLQLNPERCLLPYHENLLASHPVSLRRILDIKLPNKPSNNEFDLRISKISSNARPRTDLEWLRRVSLVTIKLGILPQPPFRNKLRRPTPVGRAVGRSIDRDANRHAFWQELAIDGSPAGRHDAVVRLRGWWVRTQGFLNASQEVFAVIDAGEGDFIWV